MHDIIENKSMSAQNCDVNKNHKYWLNKLQRKYYLFPECDIRNMDLTKMWKKTNNNIIKDLITYDRSHNT